MEAIMNNITGQRIKELRLSKNMSAETLGNLVGVAKTSIYRYESGYIEKMPTVVLAKLAKVLNVSPAYLMGWTDDKNAEDTISPKKQIALEMFESLNDDQLEQITDFMRFLIEKRTK